MKTWWLAVPVWLMIGVVCTNAVQAQTVPYRPYRPTLSPYLNYFRRDVGVLDRHNAIVAPTIQAQQTFQQLQARTSEQRLQLRNLEGQLQQIREPAATRTGTASGFMNYSHYYRVNPPARASNR